MLFLGAIEVEVEFNLGESVEKIKVHYKKQNKEAIKTEDEIINILKKSCNFNSKEDEKRFYELTSEDVEMTILELNTLAQEQKEGKQVEFWTSYYTKKSTRTKS